MDFSGVVSTGFWVVGFLVVGFWVVVGFAVVVGGLGSRCSALNNVPSVVAEQNEKVYHISLMIEYPHDLKSFLEFAHFGPKRYLTGFLVTIRNFGPKWVNIDQKCISSKIFE